MNATVLPPDVAGFITGGVSTTVAGRDDRLVPSIAKGVGCGVSEARDQATVFVFADAAEAGVRDVSNHCQVTALSSETLAFASIEDRRRIENADTLPFETYRQQYLSPERLGIRCPSAIHRTRIPLAGGGA